ncbi:unnamed protein product [Soboliphyme baturini]|uniref:Reverse transcriptase domain-containing protein n=1 Tax=Soboliphyme baturini TaxID=241478 RepID=A0A183IJT4_9BILA|nr:unnamed protein product [Soboliphyme baturini]
MERFPNNGLPQCAVLSPTLFNIYTSDFPPTSSKKFVYADDIALATEHTGLQMLSCTLTSDLAVMTLYFHQWKPHPNPTKTCATAFHLDNRLVKEKLAVEFCGQQVHDKKTKYLGVTLDRTLSFKPYLEKTQQKTKTRINLLRKLAGTSWKAGARTLRTTALAPIYSLVDHCSLVWCHSCHTSELDTQFNEKMRIVIATLKPSQTQLLPILEDIEPPHFRRGEQAHRILDRNRQLPIHRVFQQSPTRRLKPRHPLWERTTTPRLSLE